MISYWILILNAYQLYWLGQSFALTTFCIAVHLLGRHWSSISKTVPSAELHMCKNVCQNQLPSLKHFRSGSCVDSPPSSRIPAVAFIRTYVWKAQRLQKVITSVRTRTLFRACLWALCTHTTLHLVWTVKAARTATARKGTPFKPPAKTLCLTSSSCTRVWCAPKDSRTEIAWNGETGRTESFRNRLHKMRTYIVRDYVHSPRSCQR